VDPETRISFQFVRCRPTQPRCGAAHVGTAVCPAAAAAAALASLLIKNNLKIWYGAIVENIVTNLHGIVKYKKKLILWKSDNNNPKNKNKTFVAIGDLLPGQKNESIQQNNC